MINIQTYVNKFEIIWYFFKPYKAKLAFMTVVMFVSGLLEALNMAALYPVINYGLNLESGNTVLKVFSEVVSYFGVSNLFMFSCIFLLLVTVSTMFFKYIYSHFSYKLMTEIIGNTQKMVFDKYVTADYNYFVQNQQGKLIHTGTIAPDHVFNSVLFFIRLLYDVMMCFFLFSLLLSLTWQGTFIIILVGTVYGFFVKGVMQKVIRRCANISSEENRKKNVILNELISGIKTIKIFLTSDSWRTKYFSAVDGSMYNEFKTMMGRVFPDSFMRFMYFAVLAIPGIILSRKSPENLVALLPLFGTFAMVASRFFPSIQTVGNDLLTIANAVPNTKIVYDLCNTKLQTIPDGKKVLAKFEDAIAFDTVYFKYASMHEYLLKGVSFKIKKREVTAIVGPSGTGKTTMVNLLLRLYHPTNGEIKIDGINIFDFTNESYLNKIGYVSQETFIYNDTIKENIRFGMKDCTDEMIIEAAEEANAHEFIVNAKDGYDTMVGDAGVKLSGGQRQRIAIARAILRKPELIILDEATSSLDNISEKRVQDAINQISKHTTVVVIAHRLSTIQDADKIVVLEKGLVKEEGTHESLMENNGIYFNLYTRQDMSAQKTIQ